MLDNKLLYHKSYSTFNKMSNFLLKNVYRKYFWFEHWHHPIPYVNSTLQEVKKYCSDEMQRCSSNKFRHNTDLTQYLYRYWRLAKGDFYPYKYDDGIETNILTLEDLHNAIRDCEKLHPKFVCFNDSPSLSDSEYVQIRNETLIFFDKRFPEKASFEL